MGEFLTLVFAYSVRWVSRGRGEILGNYLGDGPRYRILFGELGGGGLMNSLEGGPKFFLIGPQ